MSETYPLLPCQFVLHAGKPGDAARLILGLAFFDGSEKSIKRTATRLMDMLMAASVGAILQCNYGRYETADLTFALTRKTCDMDELDETHRQTIHGNGVLNVEEAIRIILDRVEMDAIEETIDGGGSEPDWNGGY